MIEGGQGGPLSGGDAPGRLANRLTASQPWKGQGEGHASRTESKDKGPEAGTEREASRETARISMEGGAGVVLRGRSLGFTLREMGSHWTV